MAERFDAGSDSALTNAEMDALDDSLRALEARAAAQNAEIDALADEWIAAREPGWKNLLIIRERDKAQQLLRELMEWAEEQAEGAGNVAEKLKREGDDFEDRAYYEDAERFTLQANIYRLTAQRIREEMEG